VGLFPEVDRIWAGVVSTSSGRGGWRPVQKKFRKHVDSIRWHFYFARRHWAKTQEFASPKPFRKGRGLRFFVVCWHQDFCGIFGAHVAQLVERVLGKDEVISSILIVGSIVRSRLTVVKSTRTIQLGSSNG
jgi:hypothetical protein